MDIRTMQHAAKLAEWGEQVQACRTSGLSVKVWCEQNNVCIQTYYRREKIYLAEVSRQLSLPGRVPAAQAGQIVRVDPSVLRDEAEDCAEVSLPGTTTNAEITLRYGEMSVEMPAGMGIMQIATLMKALS